MISGQMLAGPRHRPPLTRPAGEEVPGASGPSQPFWPRVAERASRLRGALAEHRVPPGRQGRVEGREEPGLLSACTPREWRGVSVKLAY